MCIVWANRLYFVLHFLKGDLFLPWFSLKKLSSIGKNCLIFKPFFIDRYAKEYVSVGNNVVINRFVRINVYPSRSKEKNNKPIIQIGNNCTIGQRCSFLGGGQIIIENNVLIASDVLIASENHGINPECDLSYSDQPLICSNVTLREGCWIGEKVCILSGVTVGKKSIIGAGSIVTKTIPDYCIAVGNPAHVIKQFSFEKHQWIPFSQKE